LDAAMKTESDAFEQRRSASLEALDVAIVAVM